MKKSIFVLFVGVLLLPAVGFSDVAKSAKVTDVPIKADTAATQTVVGSSQNSAVIPKTTEVPAISQNKQSQPKQEAQKILAQLEIELNKSTKYKAFSLPNPARLIIDIQDSKAAVDFDKAAFKGTPIKNVRTAKRENNIVRVVFDLEKNVTFTTREEMLTASGAVGDDSKMRLVISLVAK